MHLRGRDIDRPGQAFVIMMRLGDAGEHAGDADAVAAHPHRHGLAVLVKHLKAQRVGILEPELEDLPDLHAALQAQRARAVRAQIAGAHLDGLDNAVRLEIAPVDQIVIVDLVLVGAGEPCGALGHMRIDQVPHRMLDAGGLGLRPQHHRPDIARNELSMRLEIGLVGLLDFGGRELGFEPLHINLTVAGDADSHHLAPRLVVLAAVGMLDRDDDVLENIRRGPGATIGTRIARIRERDHAVDGFGVGRGALLGGRNLRNVEIIQLRRGKRFDVPCLARRGERERVLADGQRSQELLGLRAAHRPRHRAHDHVVDAQPLEDALVGAALVVVRLAQPLLVDGEGVCVLHDELAAAHQACAGAEFVAVFGLDLIQGDRQILVRGVHVLDEQGEHLLVGGSQQVVGLVSVLEPEDVVAILLPAMRRLVGLARQQRREVHLLRPDAVDLLAHHAFDLVQDAQAQRQPGPDAGGGLADIAGPLQQTRGIDVGVGGVLAQRAQEQS